MNIIFVSMLLSVYNHLKIRMCLHYLRMSLYLERESAMLHGRVSTGVDKPNTGSRVTNVAATLGSAACLKANSEIFSLLQSATLPLDATKSHRQDLSYIILHK